jgi:long-chain fatty acid transport protein
MLKTEISQSVYGLKQAICSSRLRERRMKKTISVVALASLVMAGTAYGSGYRIPEQSADSTAKAGANVASALGADASYFNPANMSWMQNEGWIVEGNLNYIHLTGIEYDDNRSATLNGETKDENFLVPTAFMVSPDYNGLHFGLSITAPFGLAKRWPAGSYGATFAEKFALKVIELNPTLSYKFDNIISVAAGVRVLYSEATVMSNGDVSALIPPSSGGPFPPGTVSASRYVKGDALDYGWNAALSIKPTDKSNISLTYRSVVDLDFEGDVILTATSVAAPPLAGSVTTTGDVTIPGPAVATLSGSYDFDKLTVELTVDRTFWSAYKELDFEYDAATPGATALFDPPSAKNWDDTNAYRLGLEYRMTSDLTLMGGLAYDENPVPDATLSFELPDSNAWIISVGARYALSEQSEIAVGLLYDYKESREVTNASTTVDGEFTNASAYFASIGYTYKF